MPLLPATAQGYRHLSEFYENLVRLGPENRLARPGTMMLELLPLLEELCAEVPVWGLFSHAYLLLLSEDDFRSGWHVSISASPTGYEVEYKLPRSEAACPDEMVYAQASDVMAARDLVWEAIVTSGAWPDAKRRKPRKGEGSRSPLQ